MFLCQGPPGKDGMPGAPVSYFYSTVSKPRRHFVDCNVRCIWYDVNGSLISG